MTEKVPVLKHHKETINKFWTGITSLDEAKRRLVDEMLPDMRAEHIGGESSYPNVDEPKFVKEFAKLIVAVNDGQAVILPEWTDGRKNMDIACGPCGNVVPSANNPEGKMCGRLRKIVKLRNKNTLNGRIC